MRSLHTYQVMRMKSNLSRSINDDRIEEFYELSGRFIDSGQSKDSADDMAVFLMVKKYRTLKAVDFKELRAAEQVNT